MIYFVGILALMFLAVGVGLAIWVSRLKDEVQDWMRRHAEATAACVNERQNAWEARAEADQLRDQLSKLRREHDRVLDEVEDGALGDAASIAAELRRSVPGA